MERPKSHDVIKRMIPPLAVWAVGRILATPPVKKHLQSIDNHFYKRKRNAEHAIIKNKGWLAASAAAFALGIGFMARAAKR